MKFTFSWQELVYDVFDNIESVNDMEPELVEADNVESAKKLAFIQCNNIINRKRLNKSSGDFIVRLISLTDERVFQTKINQPFKVGDNNTLVEE